MRWRGVRGLLVVAGLLVLGAGPAQAQRGRMRGGFGMMSLGSAGVRVGYDFKVDAWSVGGQMEIPVAPVVALVPSGDLFFQSSRTDWQVNMDLVAGLGRMRLLYGGFGLGVLNRDFDGSGVAVTRTGLNLLAGLRTPARRLPVSLFAEGRWTEIRNQPSLFRLVAGVSAPMGRRRM